MDHGALGGSKHADLPKPHLIYVGRGGRKGRFNQMVSGGGDIWFTWREIQRERVRELKRKGVNTLTERRERDSICAQLVKYNSIEGNKREKVDVVYTPCENLLKRKASRLDRWRIKTKSLQNAN